MINARSLFILIILTLSLQRTGYSQDQNTHTEENRDEDAGAYKKEEFSPVRPGMEIKKIGGLNMVVPEGTQFYMEGAQVKMEEGGEYAARRFKEMDAHLQKMEERLGKIEEEMKELRKIEAQIKELRVNAETVHSK